MRLRLVLAISMLLVAPRVAKTGETTETPGPVVREERVVPVDGAAETWRLEWRRPPSPVCEPDDPDWFICPCHGFAFGEQGELDLVRLQSSKEVERLPLTPFFDTEVTVRNQASLRRWPVLESDIERYVDPDDLPAFRDAVVQRTPVTVLEVTDFDRDGLAAEFVLQIGTLPCGKRLSVLVGVSRDRPRLHVFGSAAHPDEPLVLYESHWERFRTASGPLRLETWPCGDHGSEVHEELVLERGASGIHATRETYSCDAPPGEVHGELLSRKVL